MNPGWIFPAIYVITPDGPVDATWWDCFQRVLDRGYRLVQLRLKSLSDTELRPIVARAGELAQASECKLLLNSSQENGAQQWVREFGLAGLHLTTERLMSLAARPLPVSFLVGASCHSLGELRQAERLGADFACLAPVLRTQTHPQLPPTGLETFGAWAGQCRLPVYALGGMGLDDIDADIERVHRAGGQGIAGISAFWK